MAGGGKAGYIGEERGDSAAACGDGAAAARNRSSGAVAARPAVDESCSGLSWVEGYAAGLDRLV